MLCTVYRLRKHGERLPCDVAEAGGIDGHLAVWGNVFDKSIRAELLAHLHQSAHGGRDLPPPLSNVRLLKVQGRGFMLYGTEHVRYLDERRREGTATFQQL